MKYYLFLVSMIAAASCNAVADEESFSRMKPDITPNATKLTAPERKCGIAPLASPVNSAIVGGIEVKPHSFPWQVALLMDSKAFCGGTLISDEWVLTAAHCTTRFSSIVVKAGAHKVTEKEKTTTYVTALRSSGDIIEHRFYSLSPFIRYDLALIRLHQKLKFNDYIQPACLPRTKKQLPVGTRVTLTGWGKTSSTAKKISPTLMKVTRPIISNKKCAEVYGISIQEYNICVDTKGGEGACYGDSGGPMTYKNGRNYEVRGITSFGAAMSCEKGYPAAYTRVSKLLYWITKKTGIKP